MKIKPGPSPVILIIILLSIFSLHAFSQWTDVTNNFADSTHMAVSRAALTQSHSIVIRSYPDSGWIVIWQDTRDQATTRTDIYAQKFDKNGVALWAADGVPVVNTANGQHYTYAANFNYRNYSVAATDSAGGFYITYIDDSLSSTTHQRILVQNVLSDGSRLIPGQGLVVAAAAAGQPDDYGAPQLIADGYKGFYVSFVRTKIGTQEVYVHNYKKQGGTLVYNGGGFMNEDGTQNSHLGPCGLYNTVTYYGTGVNDYHIWPDGQGGCNVVMNLSLVGSKRVIAFNRVVRAKKNCTTTIYRRTADIANCDPYYSTYNEGDVAVLYQFRTYSYTQSCSSPGPPPVLYTQLSTQIENLGQGFLTLHNLGNDLYYAKGATLNTAGNVNADIIAFNRRDLVNFSVTPITTMAVSRAVEKYDSLPYELCSNTTNCYVAIRTSPEGKVLDKVANINDTILGPGAQYFYDFNISAGGDRFFATALLWPAINREYSVYLQQLQLVQAAPDSFAFQYKTPADTGVLIGSNLSTGFGSNSISYDNPMVATDHLGNGVFYIRDYYRHTRISPILNGYELAWGAMGKPTGTGLFQTWPYRPENPFLLLDPTKGMGLLAWQDDRVPSGTFENIYMRRIDSLQVNGHLPLNKPVTGFWPGSTFGTPAFLTGTSKQYTVIDGYSSISGQYGPIAEILDNVLLGQFEVVAYTHNTGIRMHNGKPYLNRNYTIKSNIPAPPGASINLRLYFTTAEFDGLRTADPTILTPGHLAVIKQANNTTAVPATYTPMAGEEVIVPIGWSAVPGGYYIEIVISGFSNFFINKNENALPVTWVNVYANWQNSSQAKISWQIADEVNVKEYTVQHSKDGSSFIDVCTIAATNSAHYSCVVPGDNDVKNYYRVKEVDKDGYSSYSKVVLLSGSAAGNLITLYPNPARRVLNIESGIELREITIVDGYGRNLFTYRGQNRITAIDITKYSKGIYSLVMIGKDGTRHYRRFMVE